MVIFNNKWMQYRFLELFIVKYRKGGISNNRDSDTAKIFNDDFALTRKEEILPYVDSIKDVIYN
jgi:hypothetical protein